MARAPVALALVLSGCGIENTFLPPRQTDLFYQAPADQVDILFVVDDSASMGEEQRALADGFGTFLSQLEASETAYRIALVSTSQDQDDPDRTRFIGDPAVLNPTTDTMSLFQQRVLIGVDGSDHEKGLEAAAASLEANPGFLRTGANLVVVFVTDEDDCSDGGQFDSLDGDACYRHYDELTPVQDLVRRVRRLKTAGETVKFGGIVGPLDRSCPYAWSSTRYVQAVLQTGGPLARICDADWTPSLEQLGALAVGIEDEWVLTYPPDPSTLQVFVDDLPALMDPDQGWTWERVNNSIKFHGDAVPPRNAEIRVQYEVNGSTESL
jgi:hypothetical protein